MSALASILCTAVVLFPLWQPIWEQEPLSSQAINISANHEISTAVLAKLREGYKLTDASSRGRIVVDLAEAPIPANLALLLEWLEQEKEPALQATLLRQIGRMDLSQIPPSKIAVFLSSQALPVVESAIQLYGKLPAADYSLLEPFLSTSAEKPVPLALRLTAWQAYREHPRKAGYLGRKILAYRQDISLQVQALALATAATQEKRLPDVLAWLDEAVKGPACLRLEVARDPYPETQGRLRLLLSDTEPGIRQAICVANNGTHLPVILTALQDQEAFVRLAALQAVTRFQHQDSQGSAAAILLFADSDAAVRAEAEHTLVALAAQTPCTVPQLLLAQLSQNVSTCRLHAMQALARLQHHDGAAAIAATLPRETLSENIAAGLIALGELSDQEQYSELILPLAKHQSPQVRAAVAFAVGKLHSPGGESVLQELCQDKRSEEVREAAFLAMGHFPQGVFAEALLTCLKKTSSTTAIERRNAAWATGKILPANSEQQQQLQAVARRLILQCTIPVIPGMEPMFESNDVIGNAIFSLTSLCRRFPKDPVFSEALEKVLHLYEIPWEDYMNNPNKYQPSAQMAPPIDATTNSLAFQARQWLLGQPFSSIPAPASSLSFSYNQTRSDQE